jgi:hypothetical protein
MPTGIDDTTVLVGSSHGWKRNQRTTTMNGTTAKTACLLDTQERSDCGSGKRAALCILTAESPWNFTAKLVKAMVVNVMPMRLRGRSTGKTDRSL